jgi:hypothetical protein
MCRGDISLSPTLCQLCVQDAIKRISSECPTSKDAIIWYDKCLLRYSYHSLLSGIDTSSPKFHQFNMANASNQNLLQSFATWILANTLYGLQYIQTETGDSTIKNYETRSVKLNNHQTLYTLVQCTPDLSDGDCSTCLKNIFQNEIPWSSLASPEGKILYPSCYMMFGLSQFYRNGDEPEGEVSFDQYYLDDSIHVLLFQNTSSIPFYKHSFCECKTMLIKKDGGSFFLFAKYKFNAEQEIEFKWLMNFI